MPPPSVVRDQSGIPWHIQRYEIYQPPSFVARTPPRYYNFNLLSPHAKERIQWELALACSPLQLPSVVSSASVFPGVGSGIAGGSVRSSLSIRRPSMLASAHLASAGGTVGLETITASLASTDAPLHSPSLDPMNVLNAGPAANHRLSTWLKRPPESPHSSMQPLPSDATDLMDGADPFGGAWHHSSPYDAGEMVIGRRTRDSSISDGSPHTHSIAGPSRKGPSPPSQSTSAINLADEPPGSPDLLSGTLPKRKLSKRWSNSAIRGLSSLFTRKSSVDEDPEGRTGGLRGRSRPPLSPSSHSLTQQGIAFPTTGEKRPRRKRSKRRSRSSSAASVDSSRSIETTIRSQPAGEAPRGVDIVESSKYRRGRKSSVESLNSFINNKNKDHSHSEPARNLRNKIPPHKLLNYVGKDHKSSSIARKLSPTRRRSVDPHPDVTSNPGYNSSKTSFITNRPAAMLARRTTVDLAPSRSSSPMTSQPAEPPEVAQAPPPQVLSSKHERLEQEQLEQGHLEQERLESERLQQEHLERERLQQAERERAERKRIRAAQRQREEQERIERIARERDRERVEMERQEREHQEFERERIERERAELVRLEWERMERERLIEEEMRRREPPALLPTNSGRRTRQEVEGERETTITSPEGLHKSKRRTPDDSHSTLPTFMVPSPSPPPPPKGNQPLQVRQHSQTDAYAPIIAGALRPPVRQESTEITAGVPVLPEGTHEVEQPFQPRHMSVNTIDIEALSFKAREAWERERLDKGQSVLVPGRQRAVIPDVGSPRPTPAPLRQAPSDKNRSQTPVMFLEKRGPVGELSISVTEGVMTIVNPDLDESVAVHGKDTTKSQDSTGRQRMARSQASKDSIGEMHVVTNHVVGTSQYSNEPVDILQSDTPHYVASVTYGCLIEHGCPDLMSLIDPSGFSSSAVAEGGFGDIWRGSFYDSRKLAIKVLRFACLTGDNTKKELKRFAREIYHWSKLDHENVNKLMGVIMFQERLGVVSEWMEYGNLRQYLNRNPGANRLKLCIQIAKGVVYLHGVNMIHGDLKACNVLVSSAGILKITDFDYSIFPECSLAFSATTRMGGGTLRWMAPELVLEEKPPQRNSKTDIYALGMTFLETITNAHPYTECRHDNQIYRKLAREEHPQRSEVYFPDTNWDARMWALLLQCWDFDPASRPIPDDVLRSLLTLEYETV